MMHISANGLALIERFEGFGAQIYRDAAGLPTIGYGHLLVKDEAGKYASGIDAAAAQALLQQDVRIAETAVARYITMMLTQNRFDALVSFTFNLGAATLQRSTLRRAINRGEHADVPRQLMRFVWAGGRKQPGLMKRRKAEAALYMS